MKKLRITEVIDEDCSSDQNNLTRIVLDVTKQHVDEVTRKTKEQESLSFFPLTQVVPSQPNTWNPYPNYLISAQTITDMGITVWKSSLWLAYVNSGFIYFINSVDGSSWNTSSPISTTFAAECVSVTPFLNNLWMVYAAPGGGQINVRFSVDGTNWPTSNSQALAGTSANNCVSACGYSGSLYIAYIETSSSNIRMLYSSCDGLSWSIYTMSATGWTTAQYVSITEFNGSLFLAFVDSSGNLWISSSTNPISGSNWTTPIKLGTNSSNPSAWNATTCNLVSWNNFLYLTWTKSNYVMYLASTGTSIQASNGTSWSNASPVQAWSGFYGALVPFAPVNQGYNLFFCFLQPPGGTAGISCSAYNLVSYSACQVCNIVRSTFQNPSIPCMYNEGNSNPAYLALNFNILKNAWQQDNNLVTNKYVNDNFNCNDYSNCMKAVIAEYSYGLLTFYDYNGNVSSSNVSNFLWTGTEGLCGRVQVAAVSGSGGHSFNFTIDQNQNIVCFEPEGGLSMTVNANGTITGQNGLTWKVVMVVF